MGTESLQGWMCVEQAACLKVPETLPENIPPKLTIGDLETGETSTP